MKRVFVHAYFAGNFGDDLFVYILCKRYPETRFCILTDSRYQYKRTFSDINNLKIYYYDDIKVKKWDSFWKRIKNADQGFWKMLLKISDATVHIGGSSFVQHFDDYSSFLEYDRTLRRLSRKMYLIGSNFGPYTDENYYHQYYELFRRYDGICFRDLHTYQLFKKLNNVRYAPDVVFNLECNESAGSSRKVIISVINMEERNGKFSISQYTDLYEKIIQRIAEYYVEREYEVVFVSFCESQGDEKAINRIIERLEEREKVQVLFYHNKIKEVLQLFSEAQIVIGTRFHSIILGWLNKKKVLPIVYDEKTKNVLDDLNYNNYLNLEEMESCDLEDKLERIEELRDEVVDVLKNEAYMQFWALDKLLGKQEGNAWKIH